MQKSAIDQQMNSGSQLLQQQLQGALQAQQQQLQLIKDQTTKRASDQAALNEQAMRLSTLIGTPPPEKTAQAPQVGSRDRNVQTTKGKSALRIGRGTADNYGQGAGLNIT
jgi:hypothetical protein